MDYGTRDLIRSFLCTALLLSCACQDSSGTDSDPDPDPDLDSEIGSSDSDPDLEESDPSAEDSEESPAPVESADPTHRSYVKATNPNAVGAFGFDIALDGDTLLVGAPLEQSRSGEPNDDSGLQNGAAYVRVHDGGSWSHQAYFKASPILDSARFGESVAVDGDTVAIAEQGGRGGVHVFERSGSDWTRTAILRPPSDSVPRRFGSAVALSGDVLAVADAGDASSATGIDGDPSNGDAPFSGAVFVYRREGTSWALDAYIKASNTEAHDFFGTSLALLGDTLAVGATDDSSATGVDGDQTNNDSPEAGAVFVFERAADGWSQRAYLKASNTEALDSFGSALALSSDTLVAAAPGEDSSASGVDGDQTNNEASESGAVYVFTRDGASWSQEAYVKASNPEAFDFFGSEAALSGDRLAVAAPLEASSAVGIDGDQLDNSAQNAGAVYLFQRSEATWSQAHYIKASNTDASDFFGSGLAMDDQRLVVGADSEASCDAGVGGDQADDGCPGNGAVYILE
jgi:trimeric autotransporter adhesin